MQRAENRMCAQAGGRYGKAGNALSTMIGNNLIRFPFVGAVRRDGTVMVYSNATGASQSDPAGLAATQAELARRERTIAELEALVRRQMEMLGRYDTMVDELARRGQLRGAGGDGTSASMERVLALLDQAIAKAEQLNDRNRGLESSLDRTIALLERSLVTQEAMAGRGQQASSVAPSAEMEQTLAKYDRMLERSLAALEESYRATTSTRKELDDRDRLLTRTLDLLQTAVDEQDDKPARSSVLGRLFS